MGEIETMRIVYKVYRVLLAMSGFIVRYHRTYLAKEMEIYPYK